MITLAPNETIGITSDDNAQITATASFSVQGVTTARTLNYSGHSGYCGMKYTGTASGFSGYSGFAQPCKLVNFIVTNGATAHDVTVGIGPAGDVPLFTAYLTGAQTIKYYEPSGWVMGTRA